MAKRTVYHGGYTPVENPEICVGRNTKDFGVGFYCTIIKEQAQRWARRYNNREFHNVNCRFCGAIHSVNWANISVLSQVIHSVNERKTVQTNMISFVSHGAGILTIMEASAEHDCCSEAQRNARRTGTSYFVCTVFLFINL